MDRSTKIFSASRHKMKLWMFGVSFGFWVVLIHFGPFTVVLGEHIPGKDGGE